MGHGMPEAHATGLAIHDGSDLGCLTYALLDPAAGLAVVTLANIGGGDGGASKALSNIQAAVWEFARGLPQRGLPVRLQRGAPRTPSPTSSPGLARALAKLCGAGLPVPRLRLVLFVVSSALVVQARL